LFGNENPVEVEVGFGKGLFLLNAGLSRPDRNFFGVEVVRKYQLYAADRVAVRGLSNVKTCCADAKVVLRDFVPAGSVEDVRVYFPDPWWKKRHHKRRIMNPAFVNQIERVLAPGGVLAVMWNERAGPSEPPLPDACRERMNRWLAHGSWPYANDRWRPAVEAGAFGPIHEESFPHEQVVDRDTILAGAASSSVIASLADEERARELAALSETLPEGTWRRKLRADVYWTRRR
jgi:SAM-dependent methyltransferase